MSGNGGSAFPLPLGSETVDGADGMTLRDYFAAKAMQGMLANGVPSGEIPLYAYEIADAMIQLRGQ